MVFTDDKISNFMVRRSLKLLSDSFESKNKSIEAAKILDPCIGGASFDIAIFQALEQEYIKSYKLSEFLKTNFIGIDIEASAIELAKENLKKAGISYADNLNLKCKDYLTDFNEQGFDLIIGNPPYIGEKGNRAVFSKIRATEFGQKYYEKGMDYFYFFIEKSLELLNEDGILAMITPAYWTRADSASKLREAIRARASFIDIIDFGELRAFKDAAGHHSLIFFLQKKKTAEFSYYLINETKNDLGKILKNILDDINMSPEPEISISKEKQSDFIKSCVSSEFCMTYSPYFNFISKKTQGIFEKIKKHTKSTLGELAAINQGIVSGADRVTNKNLSVLKEQIDNEADMNIKIGDGIFVLNEKEASEYINVCSCLVSFYKNSDITAYSIKKPKYFLFYSTNKMSDADKEKAIRHLSKFEFILNKRRESMLGKLPYYHLQWPRRKEIFTGEKIVSPQRALYPSFAYSNEELYASADVYYITDIKENPFFILGYLNSSFTDFYLRHVGKKKGKYLELYQRPLSEMPVIDISEDKKLEIAHRAQKITNSKICNALEISQLKLEIDNIIWNELYNL